MSVSLAASFAPGVVACALALFGVNASAAPPPAAAPLTLDAAIAAAHAHNPTLEAARRAIDEARAGVTGASVALTDNPELALGIGPRLGAAGPRLALDVGLEQRFERGGQRGHRIRHAEAGVGVATAEADDLRRRVDAAVAAAFFEQLAAAGRVALFEQDEALARALRDVAQRRLDVGEGAALALGTGRIRLAEAQRRTLIARAERDTAAVRLATLVGLPADAPPTLTGTLPAGDDADGAGLVDRALAERPDVVARARLDEAAGAAIALADAEASPDVTIGAGYAVDDGDHIVTASVRVPLPLFDTNDGERERARAERARLAAERDGQRLAIAAEVREALLAYEQARAALALYDDAVLGAQEEASTLLRRAVEAGEVGLADVIVVQREVLEGRAGYLDARLALALARARLLAAADLPQTGPLRGDAR